MYNKISRAGWLVSVIAVASQITSSGNPKSGLMFKREQTGKVRISEIIDEHFAKATIISGKAEKNSIVELAP